MRRPLTLFSCLALSATVGACDNSGTQPERTLRVLLYTAESLGEPHWYHTSNPIADKAFQAYGPTHNWQVTSTSDPTTFTPAGLDRYDVVVFLITSGVVLDSDGEDALKGFIAKGKGFVGVHSASFTNFDSDYFMGLVGAKFATEGDHFIQADVLVSHPNDPISSFLPARWNRTDQWYKFVSPPEQNANLDILFALDESSAPSLPDAIRVGYHPLSWRQYYGGGRSFYSAMGHTDASYSEPLFLAHLGAGIEWAGAVSRSIYP